MTDGSIPTEVQKRLDGWFRTFWGFTVCHYVFGIGGVVASTIAAASDGHSVKVATVIASGCMAFVGFVQPDRQYRKYVAAWRLLDEKVNLYRHGLIGIKDLLEGMAGAERTIDQMERDTSAPRPTAVTKIATASAAAASASESSAAGHGNQGASLPQPDA